MTGYESKRAAAQNKLAQPAQELVAVVSVNQSGAIRMEYPDGSAFDISKHIGQRFYTSPPQSAQQPVGVVALDTSRPFVSGSYNGQVMPWSQALAVKKVVMFKDLPLNAPIYATPQQRPWVGLTDDEVRQMCGSVPTMREAVREAEAKLKEKNT